MGQSRPLFFFFLFALGAALPPVFARGNTGLLFKNAGEVALVVKSDRTGDLRDRHAGRTEQGFAALDSQAVDIFGECAAQLILDDAAEVGLGQVDLLGRLVEREFVGQVLLDIGSGLEDHVLVLDVV